MAKMILASSMLAAGTGLGGIVLAVSGLRGSQTNTSLNSKRALSLPKPPCTIYSVVTTSDTPTAKLENFDFKEKVKREDKSKVEEACRKNDKVYIAQHGGQWIYRENDQSRSWVYQQ